jgi:hypothetical protein
MEEPTNNAPMSPNIPEPSMQAESATAASMPTSAERPTQICIVAKQLPEAAAAAAIQALAAYNCPPKLFFFQGDWSV